MVREDSYHDHSNKSIVVNRGR
jgi:hypothetical protein